MGRSFAVIMKLPVCQNEHGITSHICLVKILFQNCINLNFVHRVTCSVHVGNGILSDTLRHVPVLNHFWAVLIREYIYNSYYFVIMVSCSTAISGTETSKIRTLVQSGSRPDTSQLPVKAPSEIITLMQKCWDGTPSRRPSFQGQPQFTSMS